MFRYRLIRLAATSLTLLSLGRAQAQPEAGDPSLAPLFPIPAEIRAVLDQRCVLCHGEVIDGSPETREDLDLSSEAAIRATLADLETLRKAIEEGEMPHEAKLSFRLRKRPEMQERLKLIKAEFDAKGDRATLLAWIDGKTSAVPK